MHQTVCLSLIHLAVLMLFLWGFSLTSVLSAVTISLLRLACSQKKKQNTLTDLKKRTGWPEIRSNWDSRQNVVSDIGIISTTIRNERDPVSVTSNFLRFCQHTAISLQQGRCVRYYRWKPVALVIFEVCVRVCSAYTRTDEGCSLYVMLTKSRRRFDSYCLKTFV